MSDCCKPKPKTKQEFLTEKAHNFRVFLMTLNPDEEVAVYISEFKDTLLIPTIQTAVIPLVNKNAERGAAEALVKKLEVPSEDKEKVTDKIVSYMRMFADIVKTI